MYQEKKRNVEQKEKFFQKNKKLQMKAIIGDEMSRNKNITIGRDLTFTIKESNKSSAPLSLNNSKGRIMCHEGIDLVFMMVTECQEGILISLEIISKRTVTNFFFFFCFIKFYCNTYHDNQGKNRQ